MSRLRFLFPSRLRQNISGGRALLVGAPGIVVLIVGSVAIWLLTGALRLPAFPLTLLRVALAAPVVLVYLRVSGELGVLRDMSQHARSFLASPEPWRERPTPGRRLSILLACRLFGVRPRGWSDEAGTDARGWDDGVRTDMDARGVVIELERGATRRLTPHTARRVRMASKMRNGTRSEE